MIATIYHDSIEVVKHVNNYIISNLEYIQKEYIITNETDFSLLEKSESLNVVFTTYEKISSTPNNFNILTAKFDYIIVLHSPQTITNLQNALFISIDYSCNIALNLIRNYILPKETTVLINKIESLLNEYYFDSKLIGTQYLIDGIAYAYINAAFSISENLQKNIYPYLSQIYDKSISSIKVSIMHSIDCAVKKCYKEQTNNKNTTEILDIIRSPKTLINKLVNKLN